MFHLIAAVALTVAANVPCPVASNDAAQAFVAMDIDQEIAVDEALVVAEEEFAARVADLGLTGAAPLYGASPSAPADASTFAYRSTDVLRDARRAGSDWPAR